MKFRSCIQNQDFKDFNDSEGSGVMKVKIKICFRIISLKYESVENSH